MIKAVLRLLMPAVGLLYVMATGVHADVDIFDEYPTLFTHIDGVTISYQDMGPKGACPIVFIMGLSKQHTYWGDPLIRTFVDDGYRVITFDNRDAGLSQRFESFGDVELYWNLLLIKLGFEPTLPYELDDMASDVIGLLDHLDIPSAHVVGASMGGMIGQLVAAGYPDRVSSFTSMMSSSGAPYLAFGEVDEGSPPGSYATRKEQLEYDLRMWRIDGGSNEDTFNETYARQRLEKDYDRTQGWNGEQRQMLAVMALGDRSGQLQQITAPTLVLHGSIDPILPVAHGEHTAALIPGSKLQVINGMGHSLEPVLIPQISAAIVGHIEASVAGGVTDDVGACGRVVQH